MSIMVCSDCSAYIDTDFDVAGVWEDKGGGFWCERCVEDAISDPLDHKRIMEALKHQEPETYADAMESSGLSRAESPTP